jgi:hypothetical protein
MPEDRHPKIGRQRDPGAAADTARMMEDSIRHAFLTHMGEQQRQFAVMPIAVRRAGERNAGREMAKRERQQHASGGDEPEHEMHGSGMRAGAETVAPKRR